MKLPAPSCGECLSVPESWQTGARCMFTGASPDSTSTTHQHVKPKEESTGGLDGKGLQTFRSLGMDTHSAVLRRPGDYRLLRASSGLAHRPGAIDKIRFLTPGNVGIPSICSPPPTGCTVQRPISLRCSFARTPDRNGPLFEAARALGRPAYDRRSDGFDFSWLTQEIPMTGLPMERGTRMVPRDGIEPPTRGFSVLCSTD